MWKWGFSVSRPGKLDQRIAIKRETLTTDDMGGQTVSLSKVMDAWAEVMPQAGNEQDRHDRVAGEAMYVFRIRNRADKTIQENDRIEWDGLAYNIRFIATSGGRSMYLELTAERGVAQ